MTKPKAPNFREADCCYNCFYYDVEYDGEGSCKKYVTRKSEYSNDKSYSEWTNICDSFERKDK